MEKGRKRRSHFCHFQESRFRPFCIQTSAASKLIKLESCGWSQMKAYSKSFNFFFLFLIFDHGKVVKVNKEPGSKKSCSKSEMVWWPNTFAVSMRQCHAGCKGWSKRKAEQQSTDAWLWYESSVVIFHALQANRLLFYNSASFLLFGIVHRSSAFRSSMGVICNLNCKGL